MISESETTHRLRAEFSLYCYPWDVLDAGPAAFAELAQSCGLTNISLAASYHGGKALLPHNSRAHVYFIEDGVVYFRPQRRLFAATKIKPFVSRLCGRSDVFRDIAQACAAKGVATTAWVVALHNTRLATGYPMYSTQNAFGDRYLHTLCPCQPQVIAYLCALVDNLARYPIDAVVLEAFDFGSFRHYAFLEKEGIAVTPLVNLLLSLCFCSACSMAAKGVHIQLPELATTVQRWLTAYFEGEHRSVEPFEAAVSSIPGLTEYLEARFGILGMAFQRIAEVLHAHDKRLIPIPDQDKQRDYLTGVDLRLLTGADAIEVMFYNRRTEEAAQVVGTIKSSSENPNVRVIIRPGYPDARSAEELLHTTESIIRGGARGVSFYNFGLIEKSHIDWVRNAIAGVTSAGGAPSAGRVTALDKPNVGADAIETIDPNVFRNAT